MKPYLISILTFIFFMAITWIGGYDFDERNPLIAYWFVVVSFMAFMAFMINKD